MKDKLIIAGIVILVLIALFYAFNCFIYFQKQGTGAVMEPYRGTLSGVQVCLPYKDTTGPQTLECALGIKTDTGEHYALDFALMSQIPPTIANGDHFTASGLITPIENLSSDHWQKYDVQGIFSVTDSVEVDEKPSSPQPSAMGKCYIGGCSSQLCTDEPGMASTCEYRDEYACYKSATCERQANGQCGWTQTAELRACIGPQPI